MTTTTTTDNKRFFLRAGQSRADRMAADIELLGISARLLLNDDRTAECFKVLKGNKLGRKPIAKGFFEKHPLAGRTNHPDIRGIMTTGKGSKIHLVGWKHEDAFDTYYVLQVDVTVKQGKVVNFD